MTRTQSFLINGSFDHCISPLDRGFSYGDGVFRTMRTKNGVPVNWPLHYQKLVADCAGIGIVCPSAELLMSDFQKLFRLEEALEHKIGVVKVIVTRGEGARGYAPPAVTVPTRVVIKSDSPQYSEVFYQAGVNLHICDIRLAAQPKLAGIKHLNRIENVLARMEWCEDSIFDGILLDNNSNVIECTMSNIFARFGHQLITPNLTECGVSGVTRQHILGLGNALNLNISTQSITLDQLLAADELIVCNSLFGAFQVRSVQQKAWGQQRLASSIRSLLAYD